MGLRRERSDVDLLVAARDDAEAFGEFYDRHIARVLAFFRRRVPDGELAMDLAAEFGQKILVERNIRGREIEVAVLGNDQPEASIPGAAETFSEKPSQTP